ncbi:MAG: butyrate kinase [Firmicutes bacterium]|nr:butyrate kinase [Bacillota bacterium]
MAHKILVINPGSTSTKIAVYEDTKQVFQKNVEHDAAKIAEFKDIPSQAPYRTEYILEALKDENIDLKSIEIIMCRGGLVVNPPISNGAYVVNDDLYKALGDEELTSPHGSLLGGLIGKNLADKVGIKAYIYDAVTSGEFPEIAKICGFTDFNRSSAAHVLNGRAQAIRFAKAQGKKMEDMNIIVCHMGGGCSVMAFKKGTLIDTIGDDEFHMSAERSGGAQLLKFIKLCFSGKYSESDVKKLVRGKGGLMAHLGTSNGKEIEERIAGGDAKAKLVFEAMGYSLCKSIGALMGIMGAKTDAVILTGGLAYAKTITDFMANTLSSIVTVEKMPGESEMEALAEGGVRLLNGEETAKTYHLPK